MKDLKKPIGVSIPVDLRNIFPSHTSRNFFYTVLVSYKYHDGDTLEDIIKEISLQLKENLEKDIKTYYDLIDAEKVKFEKYKDSLQEQLDLSAEKMSQNYSKAEEEYRAEYEETLKDYIQNFQNEIIIKTEELKKNHMITNCY